MENLCTRTLRVLKYEKTKYKNSGHSQNRQRQTAPESSGEVHGTDEETDVQMLESEQLLLNDRLHEDGYQIETVHPFFIADTASKEDVGNYEIRWYEGDEIEQFRGDDRFGEAYAFCSDAPDVIGVAAIYNGNIWGMAGASCDSPTMWQIGINVGKQHGHSGIGKMLVMLLKNEILKRGILPYYGTSMSHIASQRVALGAGFVPAWAELATSRIEVKTQ